MDKAVEEVKLRIPKADREMTIALIAQLADNYMARYGHLYPADRRPIWHFIDDISVRWKVVNPFRLNPDLEASEEQQQEVTNKEENGDQEENKGQP